MSRSKLYRATFEAAQEYISLELWKEFADSDCFALAVPGEEHPLVACILGQAGVEFGINLGRGPRAAPILRAVFTSDDEDDGLDRLPILGFTIVPLRDVPAEMRRFLDRARFEGTRDSMVPFFMAKDPGRRMREPRAEEVPVLLYALRTIIRARADGILTPRSIRAGGDMLTLVVTGEASSPEVTAEWRTFGSLPLPAPEGLVGAPSELADLPRLDALWYVAFPVMPATVKGDDRTIRGLLVADRDTRRIRLLRGIPGGDVAEAARQLFGAFAGENFDQVLGLPNRLVFTSRALFDATSPALSAAGVEVSYEPHVAFVDEIAEDMRRWMREQGEADRDIAAVQDEPPPADDDLDGWKRADQRLLGWVLKRLRADRAGGPDALGQFSGDPNFDIDDLEHGERSMFMLCFLEWAWIAYRAGPDAQTLAEKMLDGILSEAERCILRSRIDAHPSLYRVVKRTPGTSLTCEDVILGGTVEVFDTRMSGSAEIDWVIPMRAYRAGAYHFVSLIGPVLSAFQAGDAVDFLVEEGLELDRDSLRADAHLFGLLWEFVDDARSAPPKMVNFDGEPLEFLTATYRVTDEQAAREALESRSDIEADVDEPEVYRWSGAPARPQPGMEVVSFGRLLFVGGELLLETNSAGRLERARTWLDRIPGLKYAQTLSRPLSEMMADGPPPDERMGKSRSLEMTPDLEAAIREQLRTQYFAWLDTALPMFDGKTPREMAQTPEGRTRVAAHIRAFPRASGQVDMPVPTDEMLRELGIEDA